MKHVWIIESKPKESDDEWVSFKEFHLTKKRAQELVEINKAYDTSRNFEYRIVKMVREG